MRRLLYAGFVVAGLLAAVVVPGASARSGSPVKLSLLPLPAAAIGPAAKSLPLERASSGVFTDPRGPYSANCAGMPVAPNCAFGESVPSGSYLTHLGFIAGYALDYGLGASGGSGVTEVRTSIARYKTPRGANKALAFLKELDPKIHLWVGGGLSVSTKKQNVAAVGARRFAFLVSYTAASPAASIAPLYGVDEEFTQGRYQADVTVWASTAKAAENLAPRLANKLDARIRRAGAGNLHAQPVKLPWRRKPGPPPGGPDLSQLALQTTDLSGPATAFGQNYAVGGSLPLSSPFALSTFWGDFIPAGQFKVLGQAIEWFATANEASFEADVDAAFLDQYSDPLDLSSLGDGARGAVDNGPSGDSAGVGLLVFSTGQLEEGIFFSSDNPIEPSDAESVAQNVANYINTAGLGS